MLEHTLCIYRTGGTPEYGICQVSLQEAKHDVVFKALFVYHHDILAAFLHDVLDLPITVKSHIDVKNPEIIPVFADGKTCRLDIHVETENRKFNVEMQSRADGFSTVMSIIHRFPFWKTAGIRNFLTSCPSTLSNCRKCRRRSIPMTRNNYGCI